LLQSRHEANHVLLRRVHQQKKKQTGRDRFLAEIAAVTPWPALVAALLPTIKCLFNLALRQATGMAQSLPKRTGLDCRCPTSGPSAEAESIFR